MQDERLGPPPWGTQTRGDIQDVLASCVLVSSLLCAYSAKPRRSGGRKYERVKLFDVHQMEDYDFLHIDGPSSLRPNPSSPMNFADSLAQVGQKQRPSDALTAPATPNHPSAGNDPPNVRYMRETPRKTHRQYKEETAQNWDALLPRLLYPYMAWCRATENGAITTLPPPLPPAPHKCKCPTPVPQQFLVHLVATTCMLRAFAFLEGSP